MSQPMRSSGGGVRLLPAGTGSLARGVPPAPEGTLFVLGDRGGISVVPTVRFVVIFGRNEPDVHVCVGMNDPAVSRQHGVLRHDGWRWVVHNTGRLPIRLPGSQLLLSGGQEPLPVAYTPLFIQGHGREHLLEVRITGPAPVAPPVENYDDSTSTPVTWALSELQRLVLVALGQRYLRHEAYPQPLSWSQVAEELSARQPGAAWTSKRAEHVVSGVRAKLAGRGVRGLTRDEVGEPVGNVLNHNLIVELLLSTTIVPPDLRLLDGEPPEV